MSRVTARRYLEYLADAGTVSRTARYGAPRPTGERVRLDSAGVVSLPLPRPPSAHFAAVIPWNIAAKCLLGAWAGARVDQSKTAVPPCS